MEKNVNWTPYIIGAGLITGIALLLRKKSDMEKLSKNFNWSEFQSKDGAPMPDFVKENIKKLVKNLEVIRAAANGAPMRINSGYRSPAHNASIGGAKNSFHMKGMAADFTIKGLTIPQSIALIENLISQGKIMEGGLGTYKTFIHYDIQGKKRRWNG
jgi:uncharacterized protein YcbK (DUF882 family)